MAQPAQAEEAAEFETAAQHFCALVQKAMAANTPDAIDRNALGDVLQAAVRAYAFKTDKAGRYLEPYPKGAVTVTDTVMAANGIIRAADLNLWDLAMWFNRSGSAPVDDTGRGGEGR